MRSVNATSHRIAAALLCLSLLGLAVGCGGPKGDTPPTAPVSGTVTYKGEPVEEGTVVFHPEGGERPAFGDLGPGGQFTLTTFEKGDGAVIGKHKVVIGSMDDSGSPGLRPDKSGIPPQYGMLSETPLTKEVTEGENNFEIELED